MFTAGLVLAKYLKAIMKHLLVCRTCNMYVDKLVEMICNSLIKDSEILSEMDSTNVTADKTMPGGVPVYSYILDGDFPQMRRDAYNAPLKTLKTLKKKEKKNVNICKSIIVSFFEKHCI
jgi:recombinational DNA repair protein RecR